MKVYRYKLIRIHLFILITLTFSAANCQSTLSWADIQDDFLKEILTKWKNSSKEYSNKYDLSKVQQIENRLTIAFDDVRVNDKKVKSVKWTMLKFLFDNGLINPESDYFIFETFRGDRILFNFLNENNLETSYQIVMHGGNWKVRKEVTVNGKEIIKDYLKTKANKICANYGRYSNITIINRYKNGVFEIKVRDESCNSKIVK